MDIVSVDLENCYGIRKLTYQFDFSTQPACAVCTPNGSMKTSLADTFKDITDDEKSQDPLFLIVLPSVQ